MLRYPGVELVLDARAEIAESPTWSAEEQALYWIAIREPALHRLHPQSGETRSWTMPAEIGCFALRADGGGAILGLRSGLFSLDFAAGEPVRLADPPFDPALQRFNEGGCDPAGRFWLGTEFEPKAPHRGDPPEGALFSYSHETGLVAHDEYTLTPNGLGWSPDGRTMYFTHSRQRTIYAIGFDAAGGRLGKRLVFDTVRADLGVPDGAAVDEDGCYWCAIHGGARIRRYRPSGAVDREIRLPASYPTMPAFGGPDLDELYITTAAEGLSTLGRLREPHAGGIFRCKPGVRGLALAKFGFVRAPAGC